MPRLRRASEIVVSDTPCGVVKLFDPFRVKPFADQIRKRFRGIADLAASIAEVGQSTPIKVRLLTDTEDWDAELVDGERRLMACRTLRRPIEAYVDTGVEDAATQFAHCVAANFGRQEHDCLEIAHAIERLKDFGKSTVQIAAIFGKSNAWVSQHVRLLLLAPEVQQMLVPPDDERLRALQDELAPDAAPADGAPLPSVRDLELATLTFSIAQLLVPLPFELQKRAAEEVRQQGMSMVAARRYIRNVLRGSGRPVGVHRGPKEQWQAVESLSSRLRDMVGTYLDMKGPEFDHLVRSAAPDRRSTVARALRFFSEEVVALAESIESVR